MPPKPTILRRSNQRLAEAQAKLEPTLRSPHAAREIELVSRKPDGPGATQRGTIPTIRVTSYRALVRIAGFFKYQSHGLYYRGQTKAYGNMQPSLFRGVAEADAVDEVEAFVEGIRHAGIVDARGGAAVKTSTEPMLQHYGFATRWLDVVDSLPHALFFALNERVLVDEKAGVRSYIPSARPRGYVYFIGTGEPLAPNSKGEGSPKGIWDSVDGLRVCDLRAAKPSVALRPHVQHGSLITGTTRTVADFWPYVVAQVEVDTSVAKTWIGGLSLAREEMFPPVRWDGVYGSLAGTKAKSWYANYRWRKLSLGSVDAYDFCGFSEGNIGPPS